MGEIKQSVSEGLWWKYIEIVDKQGVLKNKDNGRCILNSCIQLKKRMIYKKCTFKKQ